MYNDVRLADENCAKQQAPRRNDTRTNDCRCSYLSVALQCAAAAVGGRWI